MPDIVVSDIAALAIASAIKAQTLADKTNTGLLIGEMEKLFGSTAKTASIGGLTAQTANVVIGLDKIVNYIESNSIVQKDMGTAIGSLARSIDLQTKALANIQHTLTQMENVMEIATVDQQDANAHHQAVVADSRAAQGKDDIVVTTEDQAQKLQKDLLAQAELKKQVFASGTIQTALTYGAVEGQALALKWYTESGLEKYFLDTWITIKGQATALYAELKTKEKILDNKATIEQTINDPLKK